MRKESQKYNHYNHGVGLAMVHRVFCPKRRKKVLAGEIRDRLFELWQALSSEKGWHMRALEIAPDHVHLFLEVQPTDPIHLVVKAFKGRASRYLRQEFPSLHKLPSLWSRSYFFCTAGNASAGVPIATRPKPTALAQSIRFIGVTPCNRNQPIPFFILFLSV